MSTKPTSSATDRPARTAQPSRASAAAKASPAAIKPAPVDPHFRIADAATFGKITSDSRHAAAAYFYLELDCLVHCAGLVAADFFARPQLYTALGRPPLAPALAELAARCGSDERIPNQAQRDAIYLPLFGRTAHVRDHGKGDFPRLRDALIAAASAYAERVFDTGEEMLRERVRTEHRPLRDYLQGLAGDALEWSSQSALAGAARDRAYPILRNEGVCAIFGISTPPGERWPYLPDSNGDKLIEEVTRTLAPAQPPLTREQFSNRQRAAVRGAEALIAVIDYTEDGSAEELASLITRCYTWGSALASVNSGPQGATPPLAEG
ncbi:hypothetical protein [Streptomyces pseudovenezuelae]|uniref:hypothetical protein n=1 Tax=Streptomyces pseudovenezuelae TaxID=67350 RepID=UPI0024738D81|nr:hypothetical protein [Streptomyces pseudovenezuelae]